MDRGEKLNANQKKELLGSLTRKYLHYKIRMNNIVIRWVPRTVGTVLLLVGTVGGLSSIAIFSHSTLRHCPYARYMLVAALFDLMTLDHPLLLRILADGWGIDWISTNETYCKMRFFTGQINSFVPITMICLAAVDRWMVNDASQ